MNQSVREVGLYVRDQDEALSFYVEKLGFQIHTDVRNGEYRWLTVQHPDQPSLQLGLFRRSRLEEAELQRGLVWVLYREPAIFAVAHIGVDLKPKLLHVETESLILVSHIQADFSDTLIHGISLSPGGIFINFLPAPLLRNCDCEIGPVRSADETGGHRVEGARRSLRLGPKGTWALAGDIAEGTSKCSQTLPARLVGNIGDWAVAVAQQRRGPLDSPGQQVTMRRYAECLLERSRKMSRGDSTHLCQPPHRPVLVRGGVHPVLRTQQATQQLGVLAGQFTAHHCGPRDRDRRNSRHRRW